MMHQLSSEFLTHFEGLNAKMLQVTSDSLQEVYFFISSIVCIIVALCLKNPTQTKYSEIHENRIIQLFALGTHLI